nr:MAG TPA: hypothetical protein [Caudoviricetes sp.]
MILNQFIIYIILRLLRYTNLYNLIINIHIIL